MTANKKKAPHATAVCSPVAAENRALGSTCFSLPTLRTLAERWNAAHSQDKHIPTPAKATSRTLWTALRQAMRAECGTRSDACWVDRDGPLADTTLANASFAPTKPASWVKNPRTWLSTTDIDRVMAQHALVPANKFKWLGALPRDFRAPHPAGGCVSDKMCDLNLTNMVKQTTTVNLGVVFNLDRHDESGSHWVAAFVCMDPTSTLFGVNFSNSTGSPPVDEIKSWCDDVARTLGAPFIINKVEKQHKNTECGVFSMYILIRCLQTYRGLNAAGRRLPPDAKRPTFTDLCREPYNDDDMLAMRDRLFRNPQAGGQGFKAK